MIDCLSWWQSESHSVGVGSLKSINQLPFGLSSLLQVKACPTGPGPAVHFQQMAAQSAHTV